MRELLIVGIDPGTTIGYAVLDTNGNVLKIKSSKQLELNSLIEEIVMHGSVLAVGTDKAKTPGLVEKAAARTGARVMLPREDLLVSEKDEITRGRGTANSHEKDALAAAIFAYRELEPLLQRIRKTLENEGKAGLFMEVTEAVVTTGRNIKDTLREIESEKTKEAAVTAATEKADMPKIRSQQEILLERAERENSILKAYSNKLLARIKHLNREARRQQGQKSAAMPNEREISKMEKDKSQLIGRMQAIINEKEGQILLLQKELESVGKLASSGNVVIKKLKNLGQGEIEMKNKTTPIAEGDTLLVENTEIFSEKSLELLQQRGVTILSRKKPSTNVERLLLNAGVTVIPAEGIIMESQNFAAASSKKLEELKKRHAGSNALGIIESYKEERRNRV